MSYCQGCADSERLQVGQERCIVERDKTIKALREQLAEAEELRQAFVATINTAGDFLKRVLDKDGSGRDELRSQNADLRERNADLEAQHKLSGQAYLVVVNELRKTQAERDRSFSELAEAKNLNLIEYLYYASHQGGRDGRRNYCRCQICLAHRDAIDVARAAIPADDLASSEVERDADSPVSGAGRLGWGRIQRFAIDEAARLGHVLGAFSRAAGRHPARFAMCEICLGSCWIALHPVRGMTAGGRLLKYRCGTHEAAGTLPISLAPETDPSTADDTPPEAKAKKGNYIREYSGKNQRRMK